MFRLSSRSHNAQQLCGSKLLNNDTFYKAFTSDLRFAKNYVYIESPFITAKRIDILMPALRKLRQKGVRITVNTRNPIEHDRNYGQEAAVAVHEMQELGMTVLYTVRLHRKLAIIDGEILYEGSLNILSQFDSCEVMRRTVSQQLAGEMLHFVCARRWI